MADVLVCVGNRIHDLTNDEAWHEEVRPVVDGGRTWWRVLRVNGYWLVSEDRALRQSRSRGGFGCLPDRSHTPERRRPSVYRKKEPGIEDDLKALVEPETGGDATGKTRFVKSSLRTLATNLGRCCHTTVGRLLRKAKISLRTNVKRFTGPPHPDRDHQFRFLRRMRDWYQCKAVPYGVYDITLNRGHLCVGTSSDTSEFAVRSIRNWWLRFGQKQYPGQTHLLIEADSGGSNGYRPRLWKRELQKLTNETGLTITVCHYPRGASKWNPADHRLFGPISRNWAGTPLRSLSIMLGLIRGTKTQTGLKVTARLDRRKYKTKIKVPDSEMEQLQIKHTKTCPMWNYTIKQKNGK